MVEENNIKFEIAGKGHLFFVLETYNYFIVNSTATFHTKPLILSELKNSLPLNHHLYKTFVIYFYNKTCGFCYLENYKPRQAYNRSSEVTLYLTPDSHRKGIGKRTLSFLENETKKSGIRNLIGAITAENIGSVKLFEKAGYLKAGHLKNIGEKFGRVLDVVMYQKEI